MFQEINEFKIAIWALELFMLVSSLILYYGFLIMSSLCIKLQIYTLVMVCIWDGCQFNVW